MTSIKDWVLSQLVSKSFASPRPLSASETLFSGEPQALDDEYVDQGSAHNANLATMPMSADVGENAEIRNVFLSQPFGVENSSRSSYHVGEKNLDPLAKIGHLQIKFLRLLQRFGLPLNNLLVSKVLYRIHLATMIRIEDSNLKGVNLRRDKAQAIASEQEAMGLPVLDISFKILVLGKTGVGKSSTINSVFDQTKTVTDAFRPATNFVQEIVGTVNGIKISFIDTPGLLPSSPSSVRKNRKILLAVKRFVRNSPPDIVLYFERLDLINMGYSDLPLLKLVTEVFGPSVWFNTIIVMTHSSPNLPEGSNGYPINYQSYVSNCSDLVQYYIHQAVSDSKLENPVVLVDNGDKILPNGQDWKSQFLLLCACTKVLCDVNTILNFKDSIELGKISNTRLPSLPHLLSLFLKHHPQLNVTGVDTEIDEVSLSDSEEEDEYDQLPPIRILMRAQFEKLNNSQKKEYLDELDYRETLYLKKQLREESRRQKERRQSQSGASTSSNANSDDQEGFKEPVLLPDIAVPPSFDSDCPVHRYRCLVTNDQWLARPVLDPNGWDHDVGFDGINLETAAEIRKDMVVTSLAGQMSKDKQDFNIQSQCTTAFIDRRGSIYSVGLDVQSAGKELICTFHSNAKVRNFKHNITEGGISVTSFGDRYFCGAKLEKTIWLGKKVKFVVNGGRMDGVGQMAYGGSFQATLRGKDYPVRNESISLTTTLLSFNKETVLSGNLQADFRMSRGTQMSLNANLNSRKMGQICIKTSSSDHMEIALVAVVSIVRGLLRRKPKGDLSEETI